MLRALSQCLAGRDVPAVGQVPASLELPLSGLLGTLNRLPTAAQKWAYAASGWAGAIPLHKAGRGTFGRTRCVGDGSLSPTAVTR